MQLTKALNEQTNEKLFALYQKDHSMEIKQELTLRYIYIVKTIAVQTYTIYSGFTQLEDIINEGVIAIMQGIDRYDPTRDNKFETFISRRIRGMVIDLARKNDWMPRDYHKQKRLIEDARVYLSDTLGHAPVDEEIAEYLQMDVQKCRKIQRMSTMVNVLSLDMLTSEDEERQSLQIPSKDLHFQPERAYLRDEALQLLVSGIDTLNEKEKMVISLYYVEELNMSQIAQVMQVSEPRISQIHSAAVRKLKEYMTKHH